MDATRSPARSEPLDRRAPARAERSAERAAQRTAWLLAPLCLLASVAGAALVLRAPAVVFAWVLGALIGVALLWTCVSVFFPARADRSCPHCGEPGLVRIEDDALRGLRCTRCGFQDEDASAFLIAESEGPIERAVLRERAERRPPRARTESRG